jgi:hypothetical protein
MSKETGVTSRTGGRGGRHKGLRSMPVSAEYRRPRPRSRGPTGGARRARRRTCQNPAPVSRAPPRPVDQRRDHRVELGRGDPSHRAGWRDFRRTDGRARGDRRHEARGRFATRAFSTPRAARPVRRAPGRSPRLRSAVRPSRRRGRLSHVPTLRARARLERARA